MEQGCVEHCEVTFGVLDLAFDVIEPINVCLDEFWIECVAWPTADDTDREAEPVGVLEGYHSRHRLNLVLPCKAPIPREGLR
jgi:hypothetical protein